MPEFDREALKQALTVLDGNPVELYQRQPLRELPVSLTTSQGSKGGYFHGI
jgi:L,D-transpeptidase ErfK/SrfK